MQLIFDEFLNDKVKEAFPNRSIFYVDIKSEEYLKITEQKSSSKCHLEDSSFEIDPLYVSLLTNASAKQVYTFNECLYFIYRVLYSKQNNCCQLHFKRTNCNIDGSYTSYAYCCFETCNQYIFKANKTNDGGFKIVVLTNKNELRHTCYYNKEGEREIVQKSSQIRGPLRNMFMNLLKDRKTFAVRNQQLQRSSKGLLEAGISEVPSAEVMRKIRFEGNRLIVSDKDPYVEIENLMQNDSFIVHFSREPFVIHLKNMDLVRLAGT